jgi:hypothetical protein
VGSPGVGSSMCIHLSDPATTCQAINRHHPISFNTPSRPHSTALPRLGAGGDHRCRAGPTPCTRRPGRRPPTRWLARALEGKCQKPGPYSGDRASSVWLKGAVDR